MPKLIQDPFFSVTIDPSSVQADPSRAIWNAMHTCKRSNVTSANNYTRAIIDNALKFGHWDVCHHASIKLVFCGFPHSTAMQFRTHRQASVLVESKRYSDELYQDCAEGSIPPEELFYFPPCGDARFTTWSLNMAKQSCKNYCKAIEFGQKQEDARNYLISGYRQEFTISATFAQWFHIFDRRCLADTQLEAQTAAWLALGLLQGYNELFEYYRSTRAGRASLAP